MPIQKSGPLRKHFLSVAKFVVAAAVIAVLLYTSTCQRRSKIRPRAGAKVGHLALQGGNVGRA